MTFQTFQIMNRKVVNNKSFSQLYGKKKMTSFREILNETSITTVKPKNKFELIDIIEETIDDEGYNCSLNFIDTSLIKDMRSLFFESNFNGDISKWDVSRVENMSWMFYGSDFNGDISEWNVSKVENMEYMFAHSVFNKDISKWNVSNVSKVKNMKGMFHNCPLDKKPDYQPTFNF